MGETPADPPLGCGEWDHMSASHTKYFIFILFTLAATSHYQNGGVNSNEHAYKSFAQPLCILRPLDRYRGSKLPQL